MLARFKISKRSQMRAPTLEILLSKIHAEEFAYVVYHDSGSARWAKSGTEKQFYRVMFPLLQSFIVRGGEHSSWWRDQRRLAVQTGRESRAHEARVRAVFHRRMRDRQGKKVNTNSKEQLVTHNLPREAPQAFAKAVADVDSY